MGFLRGSPRPEGIPGGVEAIPPRNPAGVHPRASRPAAVRLVAARASEGTADRRQPPRCQGPGEEGETGATEPAMLRLPTHPLHPRAARGRNGVPGPEATFDRGGAKAVAGRAGRFRVTFGSPRSLRT